jgi:DNA invertase Pin-like site-specific DNA recombinase
VTQFTFPAYGIDDATLSNKSLIERIDTSTATGNLVFHIFGALAEFERNLIKERTKAGLEAARIRGKLGGHRRHFLQRRSNSPEGFTRIRANLLLRSAKCRESHGIRSSGM